MPDLAHAAGLPRLPVQENRVFQDMCVFDILDILFGSHAGRKQIASTWRFDVAEPANHPRRSMTTQYRESDLAFAERLLREEGLVWFLEQGPGSCAIVIADRGGA